MNKAAIIDFLQKNPGWVLQYCHVIRGNGWWWLRNMNRPVETVKVDGRSATAASRILNVMGQYRYRFVETNYGL